ncbi:MAG TPA: hypothetical protein VMR19_00775 [Candidatus Saccharimonadales bacterium]|jgi:hypothetical protein|nr:hypothetical protein [Candidatus Saccharimonadales bacterium]
MSQEIEYFCTLPDCIDPADLSFCSRKIRNNPETGESELILHKTKPGKVGETVTDTITFEDPKTLNCAIDQLDEIGTAVVTGLGKIRHEHHIWDLPEAFDKTEDEVTSGFVTCILHIKYGILAPCEPRIVKNPVNS